MSILVIKKQKVMTSMFAMNRQKLTLWIAVKMKKCRPLTLISMFTRQVGVAPKGLWLFAMPKFFRVILTRSMSIARKWQTWGAEESLLITKMMF